MKITLLSLPNGQQVMGKIIDEDDETITLDGPITISIGNPVSSETAILTSRYMPLAKDWMVTFQKINITCFSFIDENLVEHYTDMVNHYKDMPYSYSSPRASKEDTVVDEMVSPPLDKKSYH